MNKLTAEFAKVSTQSLLRHYRLSAPYVYRAALAVKIDYHDIYI